MSFPKVILYQVWSNLHFLYKNQTWRNRHVWHPGLPKARQGAGCTTRQASLGLAPFHLLKFVISMLKFLTWALILLSVNSQMKDIKYHNWKASLYFKIQILSISNHGQFFFADFVINQSYFQSGVDKQKEISWL